MAKTGKYMHIKILVGIQLICMILEGFQRTDPVAIVLGLTANFRVEFCSVWPFDGTQISSQSIN